MALQRIRTALTGDGAFVMVEFRSDSSMWGEQAARRMLAEPGFRSVTVADTPRPQNYIFLWRL